MSCFIDRLTEQEKKQAVNDIFANEINTGIAAPTVPPNAIWSNVYFNLPDKTIPSITRLEATSTGSDLVGVRD